MCTENGDGARTLERQSSASSVVILEQDERVSSDLADQLGVVSANIAVLGSGCDFWLFAIIKTSKEISHYVADSHIIETGLGE